MKKLISALATITVAFTLATGAVADEKKAAKKERTIKGKAVCAHCDLGVGGSCATVIQTTGKNKDGKEVKRLYWLADNNVAQDFGRGDGRDVVAKGKVEAKGKKKDRQLILTASSIKAK